MKRIQLNLLLVIFSFCTVNILVAQKCDPANCYTKKSKTTTSTHTGAVMPQFVNQISEVRTASFTFPAGKVIEVALFSIKPGQEAVVGQDYFPKVFPVAKEYGLTGSQTFTVAETKFGNAPVQQLGFFIWDSYEQKEAFNRDPRYLKLRNIRNKAIDFLYMGFFQVEEDVTYTFDSESYYDFAALWIDQNNAPKLQEYFKHVAPIAKAAPYHYSPIVNLSPLQACTHGKYTPSMIGFSRWGSKNAFSNLMQHKTYKKYVHLRDEATPYKDVFLVKANIQ